jgi:hypothetical protein
MAIDTRDWHKDHANKRAGYVERASFRLGHGEVVRRKHAAAWRRNGLLALAALLVLLLLATLR